MERFYGCQIERAAFLRGVSHQMQMTNRKIGYLLLCLASTLLTACGGGGGGGGGAAAGTTTVRSVYVANYGDNNISQYTIDASTGALTPKTPPTVAAGAGPKSVIVDRGGKYAYVANSGDNTVSQFTIGAGGGLVPMNPATVLSGAPGSTPISIAVDPAGKFVYVANSGDNTISQYTISAGGGLVPMNPATVTSGASAFPWPVSIVVDANSQNVYVANETDNTISQFTIKPSGALQAMGTATIATGINPVSIAVAGDSTGSKYVYVANNGDATVSEYRINPGGALQNIGSISAGNTGGVVSLPTAVTVAADSAGISKYVYVTNGSVVSQYTINTTDGTLADMVPNPTIQAGSTAQSIAVDTTGKYVYVANLNGSFTGFPVGMGTVSQYSVDANGGLIAMFPPAVASGTTVSQPYSIATAVSVP
jgi:6-phosphogluconolactonase (cycloisomerase 2 family)